MHAADSAPKLLLAIVRPMPNLLLRGHYERHILIWHAPIFVVTSLKRALPVVCVPRIRFCLYSVLMTRAVLNPRIGVEADLEQHASHRANPLG